uniref:ZAD domain-containing protein n=1 Tax=Anopheles albimanus TaxID=7167 RepID=A0A182FEB9_ANOAL
MYNNSNGGVAHGDTAVEPKEEPTTTTSLATPANPVELLPEEAAGGDTPELGDDVKPLAATDAVAKEAVVTVAVEDNPKHESLIVEEEVAEDEEEKYGATVIVAEPAESASEENPTVEILEQPIEEVEEEEEAAAAEVVDKDVEGSKTVVDPATEEEDPALAEELSADDKGTEQLVEVLEQEEEEVETLVEEEIIEEHLDESKVDMVLPDDAMVEEDGDEMIDEEEEVVEDEEEVIKMESETKPTIAVAAGATAATAAATAATAVVEPKGTAAVEESPKQAREELELCRVCMGTEKLSDIFQLEGPVRISDIIMKVCTNIRITVRDHLPHKICERCLGQVRIVNEFKGRCEASDKELRKNLKRSANKTRRRTDVIVVNCPISESDNEDEPVDDDEYKVSQSEVESEPATSDDSFSPPQKRRRTPAKRGRKPGTPYTPSRRGRPGRKSKSMTASPVTPSSTPGVVMKRRPGRPPKTPKTPLLSNLVYIEAPDDSSSGSEDGDVKKARRKRGNHPCPKCDEVYPTQMSLKQHLKTHPDDVFNCDRCTLRFKTQQALINHIERHKKADRLQEEKRREREQRQQERLKQRFSDGDSQLSSVSSADKRKKTDTGPISSGRDLFKYVAPPASTYWRLSV